MACSLDGFSWHGGLEVLSMQRHGPVCHGPGAGLIPERRISICDNPVSIPTCGENDDP
jgi:hypothetical protein